MNSMTFRPVLLVSLLSWIAGPAAGGDAVPDSDAGASTLEDRAEFDMFASGSDAPGAMELQEVKFLITGIRTDTPSLYFMNSSSFQYHWRFYGEALGWNLDLQSFNTRTYTDFNRLIIAGSVVAHDRYSPDGGPEGIYTVEFWPGDPIHADEVILTLGLLREGMAFAEEKLVYHPAGGTQVNILLEEAELFTAAGIRTVLTSDLFRDVDYAALNTGEACGRLVDGSSGRPLSAADIVVLRSIPNDIGHVAGMISTVPQTPLSHINLKAIQNGTPNVFIPGFLESPEFQSLEGLYVRLSALPGGYALEEIPFSEAMEWLESVRPDSVTVLPCDTGEERIRDLEHLRLEDACSFGAKAANLGELSRCLPSSAVPHGCAIPFYYYFAFMEHNELFPAVDSLLASIDVDGAPELAEEVLGRIRRMIRDGQVPTWMLDSLTAVSSRFIPGTPLRCRSSTNNEDLEGFNGAGLYSSFTHRSDEGHISETVKQVWAGLWTARAYQEREFHRVDHNSAAMGVVVHPSYSDEQVNGVAVTVNTFNPLVRGFSVNAQVGEDMVTNPCSGSMPEEFIITEQNMTGHPVREVIYFGLSNRVPEGMLVVSEDNIDRLNDYLQLVHDHFAGAYGVSGDDPGFAMEIEFKVTSEGDLIVKQARPWVF